MSLLLIKCIPAAKQWRQWLKSLAGDMHSLKTGQKKKESLYESYNNDDNDNLGYDSGNEFSCVRFGEWIRFGNLN